MEGKRVIGWLARDPSGHLSPFSFSLRKVEPEDVLFKVLYCGMDHTDLHQIRSEIHPPTYPLVLGHEVVGEVMELGSKVKKFKVGDIVGVGGLVGSCGECFCCISNMENYCNGRIPTYNGIYKDGSPTQGGYSSAMVVHQKFVIKIPTNLALEQSAPLLCASVTAYSPLKQFRNSCKVMRARILGLGGVGHFGVLIAKAMGHHVTVISSSDKKRLEALEHWGTDDYVVSSNVAEMERASNSLDYILDTVLVFHPLNSYIPLLKIDGKLILVGAASKPLQVDPLELILGSFIGSVKETQEVVDFWVEKGFKSMIEVVKMDYVNKAFERMERK
ncbi:hypothetical protein Patl1_28612 [Pistacia atlantica]|uniref:Uncharacterized protein n=1 Tax=Pistacia atlantica TaxID=434234 RepID=A0ACC1BBS5_9ROSI|nr:hypothetical protein Patl1_28612 [Pistacia atlantica]